MSYIERTVLPHSKLLPDLSVIYSFQKEVQFLQHFLYF